MLPFSSEYIRLFVLLKYDISFKIILLLINNRIHNSYERNVSITNKEGYYVYQHFNIK